MQTTGSQALLRQLRPASEELDPIGPSPFGDIFSSVPPFGVHLTFLTEYRVESHVPYPLS